MKEMGKIRQQHPDFELMNDYVPTGNLYRITFFGGVAADGDNIVMAVNDNLPGTAMPSRLGAFD
jgi:hypothetical protein